MLGSTTGKSSCAEAPSSSRWNGTTGRRGASKVREKPSSSSHASTTYRSLTPGGGANTTSCRVLLASPEARIRLRLLHLRGRIEPAHDLDVDAVGQAERHVSPLELLRRGFDFDVGLGLVELDDALV